jgi:hypothetical protein
MASPQRMLKSTVRSTWEDPRQAPKLLYVSQPLEMRGINKHPYILWEGYETIDRIIYFSDRFFIHGFPLGQVVLLLCLYHNCSILKIYRRSPLILNWQFNNI